MNLFFFLGIKWKVFFEEFVINFRYGVIFIGVRIDFDRLRK